MKVGDDMVHVLRSQEIFEGGHLPFAISELDANLGGGSGMASLHDVEERRSDSSLSLIDGMALKTLLQEHLLASLSVRYGISRRCLRGGRR